MVYVDSARHPLGRMLMSHMTADSLEELHEMAGMVGLKRCWLQAHGLPHYDLCQEKRELAIQHGAKAVSSKEIVRVARRLRAASP